jgi:hypothetical protein
VIDSALQVVDFPVNRLIRPEMQQAVISQLGDFDVIFSQYLDNPDLGPVTTSELGDRFSTLVLFPQVHFSGFHPDFFYLTYQGRPLKSASWVYHSLIVTAAYVNKIPEYRVPELFNAFIFARLGYFDAFDASRTFFLSRAEGMGYKLRQDMEDWLKTGTFMHTVNHPAIRVIACITAKAYEKAGLGTTQPPQDVPDVMGKVASLPVFPDIAKRLGVEGTALFRRPDSKENPMTPSMTLEEYVRKSYSIYAHYTAEVFSDPRIERIRAILNEELIS